MSWFTGSSLEGEAVLDLIPVGPNAAQVGFVVASEKCPESRIEQETDCTWDTVGMRVGGKQGIFLEPQTDMSGVEMHFGVS